MTGLPLIQPDTNFCDEGFRKNRIMYESMFAESTGRQNLSGILGLAIILDNSNLASNHNLVLKKVTSFFTAVSTVSLYTGTGSTGFGTLNTMTNLFIGSVVASVANTFGGTNLNPPIGFLESTKFGIAANLLQSLSSDEGPLMIIPPGQAVGFWVPPAAAVSGIFNIEWWEDPLS